MLNDPASSRQVLLSQPYATVQDGSQTNSIKSFWLKTTEASSVDCPAFIPLCLILGLQLDLLLQSCHILGFDVSGGWRIIMCLDSAPSLQAKTRSPQELPCHIFCLAIEGGTVGKGLQIDESDSMASDCNTVARTKGH